MEERLLSLIRLALKYNASEIHFTKKGNKVDIEIRIDGYLRKVKEKYEDYKLIRYLQYLTSMNSNLIMAPQTNCFEMIIDGVLTKLRFAVINKSDGHSNGVLRILNRQINTKSCEDTESIEGFMETGKGGLIIVTGDRKEELMYALLKQAKTKRKYTKIYTIEDPIEMYIDEFIQLSVNNEMHFGYAEGIKQIMRHDPEMIMVSDISDPEAAKTAMNAADAGKVVIAGLDKKEVSDVIEHLQDSGILDGVIERNLVAVISLLPTTDDLTEESKCVITLNDEICELLYVKTDISEQEILVEALKNWKTYNRNEISADTLKLVDQMIEKAERGQNV